MTDITGAINSAIIELLKEDRQGAEEVLEDAGLDTKTAETVLRIINQLMPSVRSNIRYMAGQIYETWRYNERRKSNH